MNLPNKLWLVAAPVAVSLGTYYSVGLDWIWWATNLVGIAFVLMAANQGKYTQHLSLVFTILFGATCYEYDIFANAVINLFFLAPVSLLGIFYWKEHYKPDSTIDWGVLAIVTLLLGLTIASTLTSLADAKHILLDATSATLIIMATLLMAVRDKRCWIFWVVVNTLELIIWGLLFRENPEVLGMLILRIVFFINSLIGYWNWNHGSK